MKQSRLPNGAQSVLKLAARSMFDLFSTMSEGMMLVDRACRVVWINEGYKRFLPALGFESAGQFVGRPVDEVVPNTLMRQVVETGNPILVDLLTNRSGCRFGHYPRLRPCARLERPGSDRPRQEIPERQGSG